MKKLSLYILLATIISSSYATEQSTLLYTEKCDFTRTSHVSCESKDKRCMGLLQWELDHSGEIKWEVWSLADGKVKVKFITGPINFAEKFQIEEFIYPVEPVFKNIQKPIVCSPYDPKDCRPSNGSSFSRGYDINTNKNSSLWQLSGFNVHATKEIYATYPGDAIPRENGETNFFSMNISNDTPRSGTITVGYKFIIPKSPESFSFESYIKSEYSLTNCTVKPNN
ncbi:MAG: hypothetical protein K0R14_78 [Burkholderiales bacterium]|jgi:hypothetical protein|nr:hypothetical protein [Burkholderiales bacterium]